MKRFLAFTLICLLAACSSQHRVDPEPDFTNPDAAPDVTPEQPRQGEIESLISRARLDVKTRDYDEARVKLHQVFRRDRWNPEANTLYQDVRIQQGQGDALYQEYLDLYEKNKERGDALWFHLRPLLIKRGIKACEVEKYDLWAWSFDDRKKFEVVISEYTLARDSDRKPATTPADAIKFLLNATPDEHVRLINRTPDSLRSELLNAYEAYAEENPGSGDGAYLLALAHAKVHPGDAGELEALNVLRQGWILELPGEYLRAGLADVALDRWERKQLPGSIRPFQETFEGGTALLNVALNFYRIASLSTPSNDLDAKIKRVQESAAKRELALEDLTQKQ